MRTENPNLLSSSEIFTSKNVDYRLQKSIQYDKICNVNDFITRTLESLLENPNATVDFATINVYLRDFMSTFITEYLAFSQFENLMLNGEEPQMDAMAVHIFDATARLTYLKQHCDLSVEQELLLQSDDVDTEDFTLLWKPSMSTETLFWMNRDSAVDQIWDKPVMTYSASQIQDMLVFLTEIIDRSTFAILEDFRQIESLLWLRIGQLLCFNSDEAAMDSPDFRVEELVEKGIYAPNRNFRAFCSIYLNALRRRLFYFDLVKKGEVDCEDTENLAMPVIDRRRVLLPQFIVDQCREWVHETVCDSIGEDGFAHLYGQACENAYIFPGDHEWFKYRYPSRPQTTGVVLDVVRRHLTETYYSEFRVSKGPILAASERDDHSGHVSRLFLLYAIDQFFSSQYNVHWLDGVVVRNSALESSIDKLSWNKYPCLLQIFNRFWVYNDKVVYPCDDFYETLALWVVLLREKYNGELFGANLRSLCRKLMVRKRKVDESGNRIVLQI